MLYFLSPITQIDGHIWNTYKQPSRLPSRHPIRHPIKNIQYVHYVFYLYKYPISTAYYPHD